jgi:hypothetical protein
MQQNYYNDAFCLVPLVVKAEVMYSKAHANRQHAKQTKQPVPEGLAPGVSIKPGMEARVSVNDNTAPGDDLTS